MIEEPVAPSIDEAAAPVAEPAAPAPPSDASTLPTDKKSSAESVQPESETLFY